MVSPMPTVEQLEDRITELETSENYEVLQGLRNDVHNQGIEIARLRAELAEALKAKEEAEVQYLVNGGMLKIAQHERDEALAWGELMRSVVQNPHMFDHIPNSVSARDWALAITPPAALAELKARVRDEALEDAAVRIGGGLFLHDDAPDALLARQVVKAIRAMTREEKK